ncbi:hypothetical protein NC651_040501 [Populus alba x Populus x berolinensis]|nr:hypothetical protein NC651_040501 [Populus alba x Populus x berolinensis]
MAPQNPFIGLKLKTTRANLDMPRSSIASPYQHPFWWPETQMDDLKHKVLRLLCTFIVLVFRILIYFSCIG